MRPMCVSEAEASEVAAAVNIALLSYRGGRADRPQLETAFPRPSTPMLSYSGVARAGLNANRGAVAHSGLPRACLEESFAEVLGIL